MFLFPPPTGAPTPEPTATRPQRTIRYAGLTLVELAVGLAIVGVLIAVAVPIWNGWRDKAMKAQAAGDITAISLVIDAFQADTGRFPTGLGEIKRGQLRDPWGNAYEYLDLTTTKGNGQARKDHSLVPLNSDYDLYSKGPDGVSASPLTAKPSRDDIIRANNGRFVGPADQY